MTKRSLSFHLLVLIPLLAHGAGCRSTDPAGAAAACPGPVDIRSQEDVAAAGACHSIGGDLRITGPSVTDLRGLEGLTSIRYLVVAGTGLADLAGLSGLREMTGATISENGALTSLRGLENVRTVEGLVIEENPSLRSLDGLQSLARAGELSISANPRLETLDALTSLVEIGSLDAAPETNAFTSDEVDALTGRLTPSLALGR